MAISTEELSALEQLHQKCLQLHWTTGWLTWLTHFGRIGIGSLKVFNLVNDAGSVWSDGEQKTMFGVMVMWDTSHSPGHNWLPCNGSFMFFFSGHAQWEDRRLGGLAAHGWFSYLRNPGESGFVPQYQVCVIFGSTNQKMPKQNQYCNLVNSEFPKNNSR